MNADTHLTEFDLSRMLDVEFLDELTISKKDFRLLQHVSICTKCNNLFLTARKRLLQLESVSSFTVNQTNVKSILEMAIQNWIEKSRSGKEILRKVLDSLQSMSSERLQALSDELTVTASANFGVLRGATPSLSGVPITPRVNLLINRTPFLTCQITYPLPELTVTIDSNRRDLVVIMLDPLKTNKPRLGNPDYTAAETSYLFSSIQPGSYSFFIISLSK